MGRWYNIYVKQAVEVDPLQPWYLRPLSHTVGRATTPLSAAIMGSTDFMRLGSLDPEKVQKIVDKHKKRLDHDDFELKVNLGASRPIDNLRRIWKNPHTSIPTKLWGTMSHPASELMSAMFRSDHYNPFAHSVTSYAPSEAVLRHELGHAEDFKSRDYPGLYMAGYSKIPFFNLYPEALASQYALDRAKEEDLSEEEIRRMNRILGAGYGTYVTSNLVPGGGLIGAAAGGIGGQVVGHFGQPFGSKDEEVQKRQKPSQKEKDLEVLHLPGGAQRKAASDTASASVKGTPLARNHPMPTRQQLRDHNIEARNYAIARMRNSILFGGGIGASVGSLGSYLVGADVLPAAAALGVLGAGAFGKHTYDTDTYVQHGLDQLVGRA